MKTTVKVIAIAAAIAVPAVAQASGPTPCDIDPTSQYCAEYKRSMAEEEARRNQPAQPVQKPAVGKPVHKQPVATKPTATPAPVAERDDAVARQQVAATPAPTATPVATAAPAAQNVEAITLTNLTELLPK